MGLLKEKILITNNLSIFYKSGIFKQKKEYIINDFNFEINETEIIGLQGESGKGKTTIGKTILGLHPNYSGNIFWRNYNIESNVAKNMRAKYLWLGQEPFMMFNPHKKIEWSLVETIRVIDNKICKKNALTMIYDLCSSFKIDDSLLDRYPFELSAGQIQRFALIRIFLVKPDFIVLDEPVSSLDPYNADLFLELLNLYREKNNVAILFISHNKKILKSLTDKVIEI